MEKAKYRAISATSSTLRSLVEAQAGFWSKYDPKLLQLSYLRHYPEKIWPVLKKLFFEGFSDAEPNEPHLVLAWLKQKGLLKVLISAVHP